MTDSFDRLLREALEAPRPIAAGACLDAARLAAWAEGTLDRAARADVEAHAADCPVCQALLAAMVRTAMPVEPRPWWRSPAFVWVAPLTAAALAVMVIWIDPFNMRSLPVDQVVMQSAAPQPVMTTPPSAAADSAPAAAPAAGGAPAPTEGRLRLERPAAVTLSDQARRRVAAPGPRIVQADQVPATAAKPVAPPPMAAAAPAPMVTSPPVQQRAAQQQTVTSAPAAEASEAYRLPALQQARSLHETRVVEATHGSTKWRAVGPGVVERSIDGGTTWERQPTGVNARLLAGTAPSNTVCWMVGYQGLVLLSVDGRAWRRVPFPDAALDLIAVTATDDRSATVTALGGKRFSTTNRGQQWIEVPGR